MKFVNNSTFSNEEYTRVKSFLFSLAFNKIIPSVKAVVQEKIHLEIDTSSNSVPERSMLVIILQDL